MNADDIMLTELNGLRFLVFVKMLQDARLPWFPLKLGLLWASYGLPSTICSNRTKLDSDSEYREACTTALETRENYIKGTVQSVYNAWSVWDLVFFVLVASVTACFIRNGSMRCWRMLAVAAVYAAALLAQAYIYVCVHGQKRARAVDEPTLNAWHGAVTQASVPVYLIILLSGNSAIASDLSAVATRVGKVELDAVEIKGLSNKFESQEEVLAVMNGRLGHLEQQKQNDNNDGLLAALIGRMDRLEQLNAKPARVLRSQR